MGDRQDGRPIRQTSAQAAATERQQVAAKATTTKSDGKRSQSLQLRQDGQSRRPHRPPLKSSVASRVLPQFGGTLTEGHELAVFVKSA